jgi:molybdate transport system substrate-binding protein
MLRGIAFALALVATPYGAGAAPEVVVSAAASLTEVLQQIATAHEQRTGDRIVFNFGGSNVLARQIAAGAQVDLFISADEAQLDSVAERLETSSRVALLSNQLAVAVPDDRPRRLSSARELTDAAIRRIAIGDPAAVPAGVYAKRYLEKVGIWADVASKVVPCGSVRLALAAVENGAADAAIVYKTDIAVARRVREALVVPATEGPRIVYPAAVVRSGRHPDGARRFLTFLQGAEAAAVFRRAGFLKP